MDRTEKAKLVNSVKLGGIFSPLTSNEVQPETEISANKNRVNRENKLDANTDIQWDKIEKIIYSVEPLTFSKLARVGFYVLLIYRNIEQFTPDQKPIKKILKKIRGIEADFDR